MRYEIGDNSIEWQLLQLWQENRGKFRGKNRFIHRNNIDNLLCFSLNQFRSHQFN